MLSDQIRSDLSIAMKAGNPLKLSVLRMLFSELSYKKIDVQRELTDDDVISVLQKEAKKRRESIEAYKNANRIESAEKEQQELDILQVYLPQQLSEEQVRSEISSMPELAGATNFSEAMKIISPKFRGRADGSMVARIVKEKYAV